MAIVGNVRTAHRGQEHNVDIIFASGLEAGGHIGRVATMPLVSAKQASGIITSIIPAKEIIRNVIKEARDICHTLNRLAR